MVCFGLGNLLPLACDPHHFSPLQFLKHGGGWMLGEAVAESREVEPQAAGSILATV